MRSSILDQAEGAILTRVIAPNDPTLSPIVARALLELKFGDADLQKMGELAGKARAGTLTSDEQILLDGYERVSSFLGLLKSKARRSLQQPQQR